MPSSNRRILFLLTNLVFLCLVLPASGKEKKNRNKHGETEQGLVFHLLGCLQHKDAYAYMDLWPDMDTLSKLVMRYADTPSRDFQDMARLQGEHPERMMRADSAFRAKLKENFDSVIAGGEALGIRWESIISVRYELQKMHQTRNKLYEKLAPVRFYGYIFFVDGLNHRTYGIGVTDMLKIEDAWWGGTLHPVYEASTVDEYNDARLADLRQRRNPAPKPAADTTVKLTEAEQGEENNPHTVQKVIVERKFYSGTFDNEIPVQLYIRYLKSCPDKVCAWEAIYKFGDQDDYVRLLVSRTEDGKWLFTEMPAAAIIELTLKDGVYTGAWTSSETQTGYDVKLTETQVSSKKIERLDAAFEALKMKR